ncbi:MAG: hypothetical protein RL071_1221 [Pseudomonadota bacterium]
MMSPWRGMQGAAPAPCPGAWGRAAPSIHKTATTGIHSPAEDKTAPQRGAPTPAQRPTGRQPRPKGPKAQRAKGPAGPRPEKRRGRPSNESRPLSSVAAAPPDQGPRLGKGRTAEAMTRSVRSTWKVPPAIGPHRDEMEETLRRCIVRSGGGDDPVERPVQTPEPRDLRRPRARSNRRWERWRRVPRPGMAPARGAVHRFPSFLCGPGPGQGRSAERSAVGGRAWGGGCASRRHPVVLSV